MTGTGDIAPDRQPSGFDRSRKLTRRTQPYRRRKLNRPQGPTLEAMLKGGPVYLPNPMDQQRAFMQFVSAAQRNRI